MKANELELFLTIQGVLLALALIPFLIGMWHYRRARQIDRTGLRAEGVVTRANSWVKTGEIGAGPFNPEASDFEHSYKIKYVCQHGFTRTIVHYNRGIMDYQEGDLVEVAYLRENADIARPAKHLYASAYTGLGIAALLIALPSLVVLWFWLLSKL